MNSDKLGSYLHSIKKHVYVRTQHLLLSGTVLETDKKNVYFPPGWIIRIILFRSQD